MSRNDKNDEPRIIGTDPVDVTIRWLERILSHADETLPGDYRAAQDALHALRYLQQPAKRIEIRHEKPDYEPLKWGFPRIAKDEGE